MKAPEGHAQYGVVPGWEQVPLDSLPREVADVAVDAHDAVYLLTRLDARVVVYGKDGRFLRSFGETVLSTRPHGITITTAGHVWIADEGAHALVCFDGQGNLVQTVGNPGEPSDTGAESGLETLAAELASIEAGGDPFNRPTHVAEAPNGDLYVTDGYGNARVHHFRADGTLIRSWGQPGNGPGEFNLPHDILVLPDGRVIVADRENNRIQVFDPEGEFMDAWRDVCRPAGIALLPGGELVVAELPGSQGSGALESGRVEEGSPGRISILAPDGEILMRWGEDPPEAVGNFGEPHGVAVDSQGAIYVADTGTIRSGVAPDSSHTFQKFVPIGAP